MQRPHPEKPVEILRVAARLFGARPYHEVTLDDIAAAAGVGKGTLYVYFDGKDDLYIHLIREGFARVVERIREGLPAAKGPTRQLSVIAEALVDFAFSFPDLFRVMRSGIVTPEDARLQRSRRELTDLIVGVLRAGNRAGALDDPFPELTAQFIISCVRAALLYPPRGLTRGRLRNHLLRILLRGVGREDAA